VYKITKEFHFSASHMLHGLPADHNCSNLHGHNYLVEVELSGQVLDEDGMLRDYGQLHPMKKFIDGSLDHAHLCSTFAEAEAARDFFTAMHPDASTVQRTYVIGAPTTAENLARYLFTMFRPDFPLLTNVRVSETPKTWAEYDGGGSY